MPVITGSAGNDNLTGTAADDSLFGLAGNDILDGLAGADLLDGGSGDDWFVIRDASDLVHEEAGGGNDQVFAYASWTLNAGANVEVLQTFNAASTLAIDLAGNALSQTLQGNAGANILDGNGGGDVMIGLGGNDYYVVRTASDRVYEEAGGGTDYVFAYASWTLNAGSQIEVLQTVNAASTLAIDLTGNAFSQTLQGNAGHNILDGNGGGDVMIGLGGDDYYVVRTASDLVYEETGGGTDHVFALVDWTLNAGSQIEVLQTVNAASTLAIDLTGNAFSQTLQGNAGANILDGNGGGDVMIGLGGDDFYVVRTASDLVYEETGGGNDAVFALVDWTLNAGSQVEVLQTVNAASTLAIDLTGNALSQTLQGNAGANILDGNGGGDVMIGLGGDDWYVVRTASDLVYEETGAGNDIVFAYASWTLNGGSQVELLQTFNPASTLAIDLTGNELAQTLQGNAGSNILDGGGGADTLFGFGGGDSFAFTAALGAGNIDTIVDFTVGVDRIRLGGEGGQPFALLASGALGSGAFVVGAAALQSDDVILYNQATGALLYDADGNGAGTAVQFATLAAGLNLSAADFIVSGAANGLPVFSSGGTATVAENSATSTIVYQAAAADPNGDRITYTLGGADAAAFTIDANGAVRLIASADFETKPSYSITVIASDSSPNGTSRNVAVTVTDVADVSTPTINETAAANDTIGAAQTIDRNTLAVAPNPNLTNDDLPSATIQGGLPTPSDKDFFKITLTAGELLILDVDNGGGTVDTVVRIYNAAGQEILSNDDPGSFDPGSSPGPYAHNTDSYIRFRPLTSGDYYFSIEPFPDAENPTSGTYRINISLGPVATPAEILAEDVDALLSGASWPGTQLTYAFPNVYTDFPPGFGDGEATATSGYEAFTATQQAAVQQMLAHISQVSGLTFQQVVDLNGSSDGAANLRYAESNLPEVAYAYLPTGDDVGGSAWFNHTDFNDPVRGSYDWMGILHETGHALGLKHGHETPAISFDHDSLEYSVMTYRSYPGAQVDAGGYTNETWGYPQSLMMLDIAALQRLYGANFTFNSGNSVYTWSPTTGQMSINGAGQGAAGANRVFLTVWDGGGTDTYNLSNYAGAVTIDLRPGEWSQTSAVQLANLGNGNFARGNIANALLFNGDVRSLIENAVGGSGADQITANQAKNTLTGGAGGDTFVWNSVADVGLGAQADVLADFTRGQDRIRLTPIDANSNTAANDDFTFVGSNAFSGVAGELRTQVSGSAILVQGDVNGDAIADFELIVNNQAVLGATDFWL